MDVPGPRRGRSGDAQGNAALPGAERPGRRHARALLLARPGRRSAGLLKVQAGDEHPRVRLEAVRAASFFRGADVPAAQEVALESLLSPSDDYLKFTLDETMKTLDARAGNKPK